MSGLVEMGQWAARCSCGERKVGTPEEVEQWTREHDDSPKQKHVTSWDVAGVKPWSRDPALADRDATIARVRELADRRGEFGSDRVPLDDLIAALDGGAS